MGIVKFSFFFFWSLYDNSKSQWSDEKKITTAKIAFLVFWGVPFFIFLMPLIAPFLDLVRLSFDDAKPYILIFFYIFGFIGWFYVRKGKKIINIGKQLQNNKVRQLKTVLFIIYFSLIVLGIVFTKML